MFQVPVLTLLIACFRDYFQKPTSKNQIIPSMLQYTKMWMSNLKDTIVSVTTEFFWKMLPYFLMYYADRSRVKRYQMKIPITVQEPSQIN